MSSYVPRTTVPANDDPNYTLTAYGGLNPCIPGDPPAWIGSALANCVGYTTGRWIELLGTNPGLCPYDAKYWWAYNDGYDRGSTPRLGAIICFTSAGAGHVAVVESISADGTRITTSNSAYQQTIYYNQNLYLSNNWTWSSNYTFQGFIYLPTSNINVKELLPMFSKKRRNRRRK